MKDIDLDAGYMREVVAVTEQNIDAARRACESFPASVDGGLAQVQLVECIAATLQAAGMGIEVAHGLVHLTREAISDFESTDAGVERQVQGLAQGAWPG